MVSGGIVMKFYKFALWKAYFDTGYGLMSYPKYILILMGIWDIIANKKSNMILIVGFIFGLFCFILGWIMFKSGFIEATIEVQNKYNLFVKEVREKIKKKVI